MEHTDWDVNKSLETRYRSTLGKLIKFIMSKAEGLSTPAEFEALLYGLTFSKEFRDVAVQISKAFVIQANTSEAKNWRQAASGNGQGKFVYQLLKSSMTGNVGRTINDKIIENANLITKMPYELSKSLTNFVASETFKGVRAESIASTLYEKLNDYSKAKIDTIARTEASKAQTALTQARSQDAGVKWYVWRTANDGNRVRESHRHMQRVIVPWNDPPSPEELVGEKSVGRYHSGEIWNCRCYAAPLILLSQVQWPSKVYFNGSIRTMSKAQFEKIM